MHEIKVHTVHTSVTHVSDVSKPTWFHVGQAFWDEIRIFWLEEVTEINLVAGFLQWRLYEVCMGSVATRVQQLYWFRNSIHYHSTVASHWHCTPCQSAGEQTDGKLMKTERESRHTYSSGDNNRICRMDFQSKSLSVNLRNTKLNK